jgi:hypothetical protein
MSPNGGPEPLSYAQAGVSLHAADAVVERMRRAVASTRTPNVLGDLGGFAGLVSAGGYRDPCSWRHRRRGHEAAAAARGRPPARLGRRPGRHVRQRRATCGAEPTLFLDYIAVGRPTPSGWPVVEGVADGCREAGCALGGETAECPTCTEPTTRPGGICARHRRARRHRRRLRGRGRRRGHRPGRERRARQRLHAGAPIAGAGWAWAGRRAGRSACTHAHLRARGRGPARGLPHAGHGAHHGRRAPRQSPARAARGPGRVRGRAAAARGLGWLAGLGGSAARCAASQRRHRIRRGRAAAEAEAAIAAPRPRAARRGGSEIVPGEGVGYLQEH